MTPCFVKVKHHITTEAARRILRRTEEALLRERVHHVYGELQKLSITIMDLHLTLANTLSEEHWNIIDRITWTAAERNFEKSRQTQTKKFEAKQKRKNYNTPEDLKNIVINMSSKELSTDAMRVLGLGMNFAVAPKRIPQEEIITEVEAAIRTLPTLEAEDIRQEVGRVLKKTKPPRRNISKNEDAALKELKSDESIIIMRADKGNATVVLDKEDYKRKIYDLLDANTYSEIKKDPTEKMVKIVKENIKKSSLSEEDKKKILPKASRPPRLYGLPKIHKEGTPLRPIVSSIASPTYNLSKHLATLLASYTGKTSSHVKNSKHLVELLQKMKTDPEDILVSFDVTSLFTNVPIEDAVRIVSDLHIQPDIPGLVKLCLSTTYFLWDGKFYEQKNGTAMGSPLSPVIANLFMEAFEEEMISNSNLKPKCWLRYVDDTFVVWQHGREKLEEFLRYMNSQHPSIKFTMEVEEDGKLPFLDVLIQRTEAGQLQHSVYRKKTHTDRYLNARSHHHPQQKRSLINTLFLRADTISDTEHVTSEKKHVEYALKKNGYTNKDIHNAMKKSKHKPETEETSRGFACLPYVSGVTDRVRKILKKSKIEVRFGTVTQIRDMLPTAKDKLAKTKTEGIYKLACECGKSYIGQTGRTIEERSKEHERDTRLKRICQSAVAEHVHEYGHKVSFQDVSVLATTKNYHRRLIREAVEIEKHENFNREDGYKLSNTWKKLLRCVKEESRINEACNLRLTTPEGYIRRDGRHESQSTGRS